MNEAMGSVESGVRTRFCVPSMLLMLALGLACCCAAAAGGCSGAGCAAAVGAACEVDSSARLMMQRLLCASALPVRQTTASKHTLATLRASIMLHIVLCCAGGINVRTRHWCSASDVCGGP
jgi:hypothetical protein